MEQLTLDYPKPSSRFPHDLQIFDLPVLRYARTLVTPSLYTTLVVREEYCLSWIAKT